MQYVCEAPPNTWFRIETEAEAARESRDMNHAVEKYFKQAHEQAARAYVPPKSGHVIEQSIGLKAHIQRVMPVFLTLRDGEGKALVEKLCTTCHGLDYVWPSQRTVQVWLETIDLMRGYGAEATDEQWKTVTDYIIGNLAYLQVNKAAAAEFGMLFGIDEQAAQGVVAYRETQGGFKTIDDLRKAPGLEAARIDALAARLIFE